MLNAAVSVPSAVETVRATERAKTDAQKQRSAQKIKRLAAELTSEEALYGSLDANDLAQETETPARRRARFEKNRLRLQLKEVRWELTGEKRAAEAEKKLPYRMFQLILRDCCKAGHPEDGVRRAAGILRRAALHLGCLYIRNLPPDREHCPQSIAAPARCHGIAF